MKSYEEEERKAEPRESMDIEDRRRRKDGESRSNS